MALSDAFAATAPAPSTSPKYLSGILPNYNPQADKISEYETDSNTAADQSAAANSAGGVVKNTLSESLTRIKQMGSDISSALTAPGPQTSTNIADGPNSAAAAGFKVLSDNFQNLGDSLDTSIDTLRDGHASLLDKGISVGSAGLATLNGVFSLVTAPLATAQHVPGIGPVATGINNLFSALAIPGSTGAGDAVEALPISDEAKAKIMPIAKQLGGLATQMIAGDAGGDVLGKVKDNAHTVVQTVLDNVDTAKIANKAYPVVDALPKTTKLPVSGGNATETPIPNNLQHTPHADLPTIDMGPKAPQSDLPVIQSDGTFSKPYNGEMTHEPISQGKPGAITESGMEVVGKSEAHDTPSLITDRHIQEAQQVVDNAPPGHLDELGGMGALATHTITNIADGLKAEGFSKEAQAVQTLDGSKMSSIQDVKNAVAHVLDVVKPADEKPVQEKSPSAVAAGVRARSIAAGLAEDFKDLPEYKHADFNKQTEDASKYAESNYEDAKKVFLEGKAPPRGMVPSLLFRAVERQARAENDYETIDRLSSKENKFSNQVSAQAQNMAGLGFRGSDSTVNLIKEVRSAREAAADKGANKGTLDSKTNEVVKDIEDMAKSVRIPKNDFKSFIDKIACND